MTAKIPNARGLSRLGPRGTFGVAILAAAEADPQVVGVTADLAITAGLERFRLKHPERLLNVGIAEQNLVGIAAGLADDGWLPFAVTFANFAALRSNEFVRHHLGYMRQDVVLVGIGAGFAMGQFGTTHYSIEDISALRAVPNLTIVSPGDCTEVYDAVLALSAEPRPCYLRLSGAPSMRAVDQGGTTFRIGHARVLSSGTDVTIIGTGSMLSVAAGAAELLRQAGLSVGVVNVHTIKPLDEDAVRGLVGTTGMVVTVEEHSVVGGLGAAVAEVLAESGDSPPHHRIGVLDEFPKVGSYEFVLAECGLTDSAVADRITAWVDRREHTAATRPAPTGTSQRGRGTA